MQNQQDEAKPLLGATLLRNRTMPTYAILRLTTEEGRAHFIVTKRILLDISRKLAEGADYIQEKH